MTDYAKLKNAELESLLKTRGLPHAGKKADMVARLQQDDAEPAAATKPEGDEDQIDWDDDAPDTTTAAAPVETAPVGETTTIEPTSTNTATSANGADVTEEPKEADKLEVDFTAGLATTAIDVELAKRAERAKRFGIDTSTDPVAQEAIKKLERAKKFGVSTADEASGQTTSMLDSALPERKRRREANDVGNSDGKRRGGNGRGRGRSRRQGGEDRRGGEGRRGGESSERSGGGSWMNEDERRKAEARKQRFASNT
ncbi:hypothetical protein P152DRAFT_464295 [Eremomyces bilateralis CBS 781.70]|uniref:SAP domain-containing protein n=1 Tax=Eremomyces bilateralis CBS 781.70 TaxID=1392243 RepID=A0A6G1GBW9_9PEZI|nr:uncharacterized protein P152DRAFT_464295 [Eremomyces bilateralis CBS 781.70]KAF1815436.1 hypothetical protein P152DRAFT_464295 [Eremomyces bilateralis CBS 781.70]